MTLRPMATLLKAPSGKKFIYIPTGTGPWPDTMVRAGLLTDAHAQFNRQREIFDRYQLDPIWDDESVEERTL